MKKLFYITKNALKDKNCPPKTEPSMINHRNSCLNFTKFRSDLIILYSLNLERMLLNFTKFRTKFAKFQQIQNIFNFH